MLAEREERDDKPRPPARTWRTRRDYTAVALIVLAVLVAGLVIWQVQRRARHHGAAPGRPRGRASGRWRHYRRSLAEVWRAPSGASAPVVVDRLVDGGVRPRS